LRLGLLSQEPGVSNVTVSYYDVDEELSAITRAPLAVAQPAWSDFYIVQTPAARFWIGHGDGLPGTCICRLSSEGTRQRPHPKVSA
jgi:hypothetical protein